MLSKSAALALGLVLVLGACGGDNGAVAPIQDPVPAPEPDNDGEEAPAEPPAEPSPEGVTVTTADSPEYGTIVVDGDGFSLYLFDRDTEGESTCYDECAAAWPALLAAAADGVGVDASLLGTTQRTDGTVQVTLAGNPLYYFGGDQAPGDANGQGLNDVWWLVAPDGAKATGDGADQSAPDNRPASDGYDY